MTLKIVRFTKAQWLPVTGDRRDFRVGYSIVDSSALGQPDEDTQTRHGEIVVGISGTLQSMWQLDALDLEKVLFEHAKRHVQGKVFDNSLGEHEEIQLSTYNAPVETPYDPARLQVSLGTAFEFPQAEMDLARRSMPDELPAQIIDLRDNINAVFGELHRGRLLSLPQERGLLELFRQCLSQEEFAYRVASLCTLVTSIDPDRLGGHIEATNELKPLDMLGKFLRSHLPDTRSGEIDCLMDSFQAFNHLRRMYPIHTDRARGVIAAHKFFGLEYPVRDHQAAWRMLMEAYAGSLRLLLELVKSLDDTSR